MAASLGRDHCSWSNSAGNDPILDLDPDSEIDAQPLSTRAIGFLMAIVFVELYAYKLQKNTKESSHFGHMDKNTTMLKPHMYTHIQKLHFKSFKIIQFRSGFS